MPFLLKIAITLYIVINLYKENCRLLDDFGVQFQIRLKKICYRACRLMLIDLFQYAKSALCIFRAFLRE